MVSNASLEHLTSTSMPLLDKAAERRPPLSILDLLCIIISRFLLMVFFYSFSIHDTVISPNSRKNQSSNKYICSRAEELFLAFRDTIADGQ